MNFINWLLGIGPNQFTPEQNMPYPPRDDKKNEKKSDDYDDENYTEQSTGLGPPRC